LLRALLEPWEDAVHPLDVSRNRALAIPAAECAHFQVFVHGQLGENTAPFRHQGEAFTNQIMALDRSMRLAIKGDAS